LTRTRARERAQGVLPRGCCVHSASRTQARTDERMNVNANVARRTHSAHACTCRHASTPCTYLHALYPTSPHLISHPLAAACERSRAAKAALLPASYAHRKQLTRISCLRYYRNRPRQANDGTAGQCLSRTGGREGSGSHKLERRTDRPATSNPGRSCLAEARAWTEEEAQPVAVREPELG
jgi:hypothetical protein